MQKTNDSPRFVVVESDRYTENSYAGIVEANNPEHAAQVYYDGRYVSVGSLLAVFPFPKPATVTEFKITAGDSAAKKEREALAEAHAAAEAS
jgi:hypothetical protein